MCYMACQTEDTNETIESLLWGRYSSCNNVQWDLTSLVVFISGHQFHQPIGGIMVVSRAFGVTEQGNYNFPCPRVVLDWLCKRLSTRFY